jgi:outer membrane lipoprotein-sorting protein
MILFLALTSQVNAQRADPKDPQNIERGKELLRAVIEARGGAAYLNFKTVFSTGQYTPFDKGISTIPTRFTDWIVYPDKERTEFGKGKKKDRRIQVNVGKTGWIYDGDAETLKDQNEKQIAAFLEGLEFDLDHILRDAVKLGWEVKFTGREELRPGERADAISIEIKPHQTVALLLDRQTHLPLSLSYEKTGENGLSKHEVRFFQYVSYGNVKFPNIVDIFRDGVQESRINYEAVQLDVAVPDDLFVKPASVKAIK